MELDKSLIKEFVQATNDSETKPQNTYLRGTVIKNSGGKYVQLDGSTTATPISEIVDVEEGDRVLVSIENHKATIIGNFSFPPSARKEQEAINKAEAAQGTANSAGEAANLAQEKAQEASNKADTAIEQSSIASASADEAKQQATDAINQANTASTNASEAKSLAAGASSDASEAKTLASQSQAASANAQAEVTRLQGEVNAAKEDAADAIEELNKQAGEIEAIKENYSTKVDLGNTKTELETEISKKVGELQTTIGQTYSTKTENVELEGRLQYQITQTAEGLASQVTKIEKIEADTTEAQKDVEEALTKANAANAAASEAQSKADAAQAAANAAASNAQSAADKATIAQNAADAATAAANAADQAVQSAQSDLNEAKQNLANVTSRVDATEADIAEAQSKVDAAQTAVNNALADAAEANLAANKAQEAADKAQQDAETAQGAANAAQTKADNAQTAANNAQAAADKAQADVAALTSRVTSAETKITQNAEQIALTATKTEEIGTKFDNLEIGGRNIIQNSGNFIDILPWVQNSSSTTVLEIVDHDNVKCLHAINTIRQDKTYQIEFDTEYVYQLYAKFVEGSEITNANPLHYWMWAYDTITDSRPTDYVNLVSTFTDYYVDTPGNITILPNTWHRIVTKFKTKTKEATGKQYAFFRPFIYGRSATGEYWVQWIKLEKGDKPTYWSQAPEDVNNNIQNITIGARNLLLDSKSQKSTKGSYVAYNITDYGKSIIQNKDSFVISFEATSDIDDITIDAYIRGVDSNGSGTLLTMPKPASIKNITTEWKRYSVNVTLNSTISPIQVAVRSNSSSGEGYNNNANLYVRKIKLEKGNKPTDWTPAPEDIENTLTNNYYSKTETDAKLQVESDRITSAVSKIETVETRFNNLSIGGRNILLNSSFTENADQWDGANSIKEFIEKDGKTCAHIQQTTFGNVYAVKQSIHGKLEPNTYYTISGWVKTENMTSGTTNPTTMYYTDGSYNKDGVSTWFGYVSKTITRNSGVGDWVYLTHTFITDDRLKTATRHDFYVYTRDIIGDLYFYNLKLEKGTKPTDWTPAPEDVQNNINDINSNLTNNYYTKTQTDAKFEIESDRITSTVTKVEETQQELDNLTISGRNMLLNSELAYPYTDTDYSSSSTYSDKTASSRAVNSKGNAYCSVLNNFAIPMNELLTKVDDEFVFSLDTSITGNFKNLRFDLDTRIPRAQSYYFNPVIKIPDDCEKNEWIRVSGRGKIEPARQLFNLEDTSSVTSGIIVNKDGWITVEYDNTNGTSSKYFNYFTKNLDLKTNTAYTIVTEIKEVSGNGLIVPISYQKSNGIQFSGQFSTGHTYYFSSLTNNSIQILSRTTISDFSILTSNVGIRSYVEIRSGQSGSITFRLSVIEDLTVTPETFVYQPYVGSTLRQLYNYEDTATVTEGVSVEDGWISVTCDNTNGTNTKTFKYYTNNLDLQTATEYAIFYEIKEISGNGYLDRTEYDGQMAYANASRFDSISVGVNRTIMKTDADFSSATIPGLGTGVRFSPGQSGSITFRISVYDDVNMTPENFIYAPYGESPDSSFLRVSWDSASMGAKVAYRYPKLEEGNRVTAWTPAPEDTSEIISKVEDNVTARLDEVNTSIEKAQSTIDQLSNMISHLVTDNNGGSLMTQTPDGWTFNMSNVTDNLTAIKDAMVNMENDQNGTNDALNKLSDLVNDVANKTAYITMSMDDNGDPCIELGKADNPFKVRITNTAIDFLEGSTKIAYANNNTFYSEKIIVKNELQIGEGPGFVWRTRANGNMGLIYISG